MNKIKIIADWRDVDTHPLEVSTTMADVELRVGEVSLTQNEDIWSKTIKNSALVSAYPLALWLASSWWRLNYEPLPHSSVTPSVDWRMSHELAAAGYGFVWPQVMFASDREQIQVWAVSSTRNSEQSLRYLSGLEKPASVSCNDFEVSVADFIDRVISRLSDRGCAGTELETLWNIVKQERADAVEAKLRQIEAEMGFDPGECPDEAMRLALELDEKMGTNTFAELVPVFGKSTSKDFSLQPLNVLLAASGIEGKPDESLLSGNTVLQRNQPPWRRGATDAKNVRKKIGSATGILNNESLCDLLGISNSALDGLNISSRQKVSLAIPQGRALKFVPRKRHPIARRFELARLVGDFIFSHQTQQKGDVWLASTDLSTSRQKYQRAFAAELLCPGDDLETFLEDDMSENAIEEAAYFFEVSTETVKTMLETRGMASFGTRFNPEALPYPIGSAA